MFTYDTETDMNVQSEHIIAFDDHKSAGRAHWLIIPKHRPAGRHIRDIEALTSDDLPLRRRCHILPLWFCSSWLIGAANTLQSKKWLKSKSSF